MYIKKVKIRNYRGIKSLDWTLSDKLYCLIGNGDSTKTTILDAIELALYPYWNINVCDTDFYNCDLNEHIIIEVTIGDIIDELKTEDKYGLFIRKLVDNEEENDEPDSDNEGFLTIKLEIDETFNCDWHVITNRNEGKQISNRDRAKLSVSRIGESVDKDFSIGRNSVIKKYIKDTNNLDGKILEFLRGIKEADLNDADVNDAILLMKDVLVKYNIKTDNDLCINVEVKSNDLNVSNINLCDGKVPFSSKGIGTKRLISSVLNMHKVNNASPILIDEVEYGLEPYRLADLLYKLKTKGNQVILTSHSPISLIELNYDDILVCRNSNGVTRCLSMEKDMQGLLRTSPNAFLSKKILVVEGATEYGILRKFNEKWSDTDKSLAYYSTLVVDGKGGNGACKNAENFNKLGYDVLLLIDSDDENTNKRAKKIVNEGINLLTWTGKVCTEKRVIDDIEIKHIPILIKGLLKLESEDAITSYFNSEFGNKNTLDFNELKKNLDDDDIRDRIVKILTFKNDKGPRFKSINYGKVIGSFLLEIYDEIKDDKEIKKVISKIKVWYSTNEYR